MSDIKQQILDELHKAQKDAAKAHDKGRCVGLTEALDIIYDNLKDMTIVPVEPTEAMISAASMNGAEGTDEQLASDYKAMLESFKEQS